MRGQGLNPGELMQSGRNRLCLSLRTLLRFSRGGYAENGETGGPRTELEIALEARFGLGRYRQRLSDAVFRLNLFTLWLLERMLAGRLPLPCGRRALLEPGCQDFARLPALRAFLEANGGVESITGIELDPFPPLHDFRSRWDRAQYYLSLSGSPDRYLAADFFRWREPAHLIFCFYPFVSPHPALAWGLPASFGDPAAWAAAFARNTLPGGLLLVVHQGAWEEEAFDRGRGAARLSLLHREALVCPFYELPHAACASVYRKE